MFHITELTGNKPQEHHLCEDHAREYLDDSSRNSEPSISGNLAAELAESPINSSNNSMTKMAAELQAIDQQLCPICGISFYEFRNRGRLGCANDYDCFSVQLEPLIRNIHGATTHSGKSPKKPNLNQNNSSQLIKLRRDLDNAIGSEDYELASRIRDTIFELEKK
jgi:protein arginine kinase activator